MKSVITKGWFRIFLIAVAILKLLMDLRIFKLYPIKFQGSTYSSTNVLLIILVLIAILIKHHQLRGLVWLWSLIWLLGDSIALMFLLAHITSDNFIWDIGSVWIVAGLALALTLFIGSRKYIITENISN
jgi:hypothetical protein